jgi:4-coumarate--CoA ligase (photoactive yellow protein activation family)
VLTIAREALRRIVTSVVTAETARGRAAKGAIEDPTAWADDRTLSVGSIDLDSLETINAAAALHEMFGFDEPALDLPLRANVTVGDWLDDIAVTQGRDDARLTVMTSGSTGRPKPCIHAIADLQAETAYFCALLSSVQRVVALVPAHHIYGLIWTALLPAKLGIPVIEASATTLPTLREGDLLVAVPDQWQAMLRSRRRWPSRVRGVSAAAPLDDALAGDLLAAGLDRIHDVYGSSETGGIAIRDAPDAAYTLLPRWRFATPVNANAPVIVDRHGRETSLPDRLDIKPDHRFTVLRRRDGAVQVGGVNVWPDQVAAVLRCCAGVADVSVRLGDHHRLKAFVVPMAAGDEAALLASLLQHALQLPRSEQRPTSYRFGCALPRNALGKPSDWADSP